MSYELWIISKSIEKFKPYNVPNKVTKLFFKFNVLSQANFFSIWHLILELGHIFKQEFEVTLC